MKQDDLLAAVAQIVKDSELRVRSYLDDQLRQVRDDLAVAVDRYDTAERLFTASGAEAAQLADDVSQLADDVGSVHAEARDLAAVVEAAREALVKRVDDLSKLVSAAAFAAEGAADVVAEVKCVAEALGPRLTAVEGSVESALRAATDARTQAAEDNETVVDRVSQLAESVVERFEVVNNKARSVSSVQGDLGEALNELADDLHTKTGALSARLDAEVPAQMEKVVAATVAELSRQVREAEAWLRGGAGYQAHSVVRHNNALWCSRGETAEEPGTGDAWALLVDGIRGVSVDAAGDGRSLTVGIESAAGVTTRATLALPVPVPRGTYAENETYRRYDAVHRDNHTFMALADDPGPPGESGSDWVVIGHRGRAGKRGEDGVTVDRDDVVSATVAAVVPLFDEIEERMASRIAGSVGGAS